MRKSFAAVAASALLLAACGGGDSEPATEVGAPGETTVHSTDEGHAGHDEPAPVDCSPSGTTVAVVASDTKFDTDCLAAPANKPFTLSYDNRDTIAHNIVFLESHDATDVMFRADIFTGPKKSTFDVPAMKPGTYAFHCEVHPSVMTGTLVVK